MVEVYLLVCNWLKPVDVVCSSLPLLKMKAKMSYLSFLKVIVLNLFVSYDPPLGILSPPGFLGDLIRGILVLRGILGWGVLNRGVLVLRGILIRGTLNRGTLIRVVPHLVGLLA